MSITKEENSAFVVANQSQEGAQATSGGGTTSGNGGSAKDQGKTDVAGKDIRLPTPLKSLVVWKSSLPKLAARGQL